MSTHPNRTLLVTGASGHLGRRVVELLLEAGETGIIAASRTPEKLVGWPTDRVEVRYADFDDPVSLATAFTGVSRLLLISTDALGVPRLRLRQHQAAVSAAEQAGVSHVIYTSLTSPEPGTPVAIAPDHFGTETALSESTLGYTVLRNNIYMETLIGTVSQALGLGGTICKATGDGRAAYVSREDCARAAATALAEDFDGRRTLDVSGPEAVSQADVARIASELLGTPIVYQPQPLNALVDSMVHAGLPRPVAEVIASFDAGVAAGKFEGVSSAVGDLTGHPPTSAANFLAAHRAAFTAPTPSETH